MNGPQMKFLLNHMGVSHPLDLSLLPCLLDLHQPENHLDPPHIGMPMSPLDLSLFPCVPLVKLLNGVSSNVCVDLFLKSSSWSGRFSLKYIP